MCHCYGKITTELVRIRIASTCRTPAKGLSCGKIRHCPLAGWTANHSFRVNLLRRARFAERSHPGNGSTSVGPQHGN